MMTPEARARQEIDAALVAAGWLVQDASLPNLYAAQGVALREFPLRTGHGFADYLLFVDQQAVGVIEAKKEGETLVGVELQTARYSLGLPDTLYAPVRPLPFLYESTGVETRFTNRLDPTPRSRVVFNFHRPETFAGWIEQAELVGATSRVAAEGGIPYDARATLRARLQAMPELIETGLWPAQIQAVRNLEASLKDDRPRALIQMATGSGKTFTAITSIYRLVKFGGASRVLFLVDRGNLGRQALKEFQSYTSPDDGRKFTELYNVQLLQNNRIDPVAKVVITTIQRLYSMLRGEELAPEDEEGSQFDTAQPFFRDPLPVGYNPSIPVETFDVIFTDEAHRSIYNLWRQVLEYFDAYLIGLTATPSRQTFGFFNQNLVMEYNHQQAVVDGVNVDYDIYRIRTEVTEGGATLEAGDSVGRRDRLTRRVRWEELDDELTYAANALDRAVVARDQIRTVIRTFRDRLFVDIFPGRREVPKTLIFAKDDAHADEIVQIVREEFGKGNDFCQKITYRTTGVKPEDLLQRFRNAYDPRIVVTVDMIATGTDVKVLEIVMFMRSVKSRNYYLQMVGRGVRVVDEADYRNVVPDSRRKTRFVLIDCVGVTEETQTDEPPLERKRTVPMEGLLNAIGHGSVDPDVLSSLAGRLARLDRALDPPQRATLDEVSQGASLRDIASGIVAALDPDRQIDAARAQFALPSDIEPTEDQLRLAGQKLLRAAARPLAANPELRQRLVAVQRQTEQTIDEVTKDTVIEAGYSIDARERARELTQSFEAFIADNKDAITALEVLYSRPWAERLRLKDIRALVAAIEAPPRSWTPEGLWAAYETLDASKVRGSGSAANALTNIVALVRYAIRQEDELVPFPEQVDERFRAWLQQQAGLGRSFTAEQQRWLEDIRDHISGNLRIERDDFGLTPFNRHGGLGKAWQLFGPALDPLLDELNAALVA